MATFENGLQAAIYGALNGNVDIGSGAVPVFDHVPDDQAETYPRITFGPIEAVEWSDKGAFGQEMNVQIDIWDRQTPTNPSRGKKQTQAIISAIHTLLHNASLTVSGASFVQIRFVNSRVILDEDAKTRHGIASYRALVHES